MWRDVRVDEGCAQPAGPRDWVLFPDAQQQVELLAEEVGVVGQVVSEKWERLGVGTPARDDLCTAGREQVDGGELLPHAHRVSRPQHSHGARQPDPDRKSTRLNSSHVAISYAVFCL